MSKRQLFRCLVISWIIGCFTLQAQELKRKDDYWSWKDEKIFQVVPDGTLKMKQIRGDVSIHAWNNAEVKIVAVHHLEVLTENEANALIEKYQIRYEKSANIILIEGSDFYRKDIYSDYEILVPKKFHCDINIDGGDLIIDGIEGKIDTQIGGGDVAVSNILGPLELNLGGGDSEISGCQKEVNIHLGGGDLEIEKIEGSIQINAGGGDIEIADCRGSVNVELGGGDIEIDHINSDVHLKVGGGDVEVSHIGGKALCETGGGSVQILDVAGALTVKSGTGDIEVEITRNNRPASESILLETGMGDIDITLPASIKASINAVNYKFYADSDEMTDSEFPLKMSIADSGGEKIIRTTGDINGGGVSIELRARGGDITIQKAEQSK